MATGLTPTNFIKPQGFLREEHFPAADGNGFTLEADLQGWISAGESATESVENEELRKKAVEHFVYWRAYLDIYQRKIDEPINTNFGSGAGSVRFSDKQAEHWLALANSHAAAYEDLFAVATGEQPPSLDTGSSQGEVNVTII